MTKTAVALPDPWTTPTLSVPEAAHLVYDVSRAVAYEMARDGRLPTLTSGRRVRVSTAVVYGLLGLPLPPRPT